MGKPLELNSALGHSAGAGGGDEWDCREQGVREVGMGHIPGREAAMGAVCGGGERTCSARWKPWRSASNGIAWRTLQDTKRGLQITCVSKSKSLHFTGEMQA